MSYRLLSNLQTEFHRVSNLVYIKAKLGDFCKHCKLELKFYSNLGPNLQNMMNKTEVYRIKKKIKIKYK